MFLSKSSKKLLLLEATALKLQDFAANSVGCKNSILAGVRLQS
jgi:hypothetical protein